MKYPKLTDALREALKVDADQELRRMAVTACMLIVERQRLVECTDDEIVLLAGIRQRVETGKAPAGSLNRSK